MRILPVLDLMNGLVVRGVAGRRAEYRPIISRLTSSAEPLAVARAFADHFGLRDLYLADLDAIASAPPALAIYDALRQAGFRLWVDAGVKACPDAEPLRGRVDGLVAGLETLAGPSALAAICRALGPERVIFSLDLKEGQPLGDLSPWGTRDPLLIADAAIHAGARTVLVLDLAKVGLSTGPGSVALCAELVRRHPQVEVWAGGGIRNAADLARLRDAGVHAVLMASALHDQQITPAAWE